MRHVVLPACEKTYHAFNTEISSLLGHAHKDQHVCFACDITSCIEEHTANVYTNDCF